MIWYCASLSHLMMVELISKQIENRMTTCTLKCRQALCIGGTSIGSWRSLK